MLAAAKHTLWLTSMPYGHPLIPQKIHCYVIEATLEAGTRYRLEEGAGQQEFLSRDDTGVRVALGRLADERWEFRKLSLAVTNGPRLNYPG